MSSATRRQATSTARRLLGAFVSIVLIAAGVAVLPEGESASAAPQKTCEDSGLCRMTFQSGGKLLLSDIGSTDSIRFILRGAAGGNSGKAQGGRGAEVVYTFTPATMDAGAFVIEVGARGGDANGGGGGGGGAGGGGAGGNGVDGGTGGGGGGGATFLKVSDNIRGQNARTVAIAAGGGGAGSSGGGDANSDGQGPDGCGGRASGGGGCGGDSGRPGGDASGGAGGAGASAQPCTKYECLFNVWGDAKPGGGGGGGGLTGGGGGGISRQTASSSGGGAGGINLGNASASARDGSMVVVEWVPGPVSASLTLDRDVAPPTPAGHWDMTATITLKFLDKRVPSLDTILDSISLRTSAGNTSPRRSGINYEVNYSTVTITYPVTHENFVRYLPSAASISAEWMPSGLHSNAVAVQFSDAATGLAVETPQGSVAAGTPFTVTARVTHPAATPGGVVRFTVGSRDSVEVPLSSGVASLTVPGLPSGTYPVSVVYPGSRGVPAATASPTPSVTVQKTTSTVALSASSLSWGTTGTLTAKVPAGARGKVRFSVQTASGPRDLGYTVAGSDGTAVLLTPTDLEPGSSVFTASYSGDDSYTSATTDLTVTVGLLAVSMQMSDAEMRSDATGRLEVGLTESATGYVDFTAVPISGGRSVNLGAVRASGGRAALDVTPGKLPLGSYRVTATFTGDPHHATATAQASLVVRAPAVLKTLVLTPAATAAVAGQAVAFAVSGFDTEGRVMTVSSASLSADGGTCQALSCTLTAAGSQTVRVTSGDVSGTTTIRVLPGAPARVDVTPTSADIEVSSREEPGGVTFAPRVFDQWGNLTDARVTVATPSGWCDGMRCGSTVAGDSTVTFTAGDAVATAVLTAAPGAASSLTLTPSASSVAAGTRFSVTAEATDRFGNVLSPDRTAFSAPGLECTRKPDVAVIRCTGTSVGVVTVSASQGGASQSQQITIVAGAASRGEITPAAASTIAGEPVSFSMTTADEWGNPISDTVTAVVKSGAATCDGLNCSSTVAGESVISFSSAGVTKDATLTVAPGLASQISIEAPTGPLSAGSPITFGAVVADRFGNVIDGAAIVLTADPDGTCVGLTCTITRAGDHTVTATFAERDLVVSERVAVVAGLATRSTVTPSTATVVAGRSATFTMTTADLFGNPVTADVTARVERGAAVCDGTSCASTVAGESTIVLESASQTQRVTLTVEPATAARATIEPTRPSETVTAGQPVQFQVSVLDEFGNALSGAGVTLTASPDGTCSGLTCTMTRAGAHLVTVRSADGPSQSVPVTIVAGAITRSTVTPSSAAVVAGEPIAFSMSTTDTWGNPVSEPVTVEVESGAATCDGLSCSSTVAGESVVKLSSAGQIQRATVTVTAAAAATVTLEPATPTTSVMAGRPVEYAASVLDRFGNTVSGAQVALSASPDGTCDAMVCTFTRAGIHAVTASTGSTPQTSLRSGEVRVEVVAAEAASVTADLPETIAAGEDLVPTLAATDSFGNPVDGATLTLLPRADADAHARRADVAEHGAETHARRAGAVARAAVADDPVEGAVDCTAGCRPTAAGSYDAVAVAGEASVRRTLTVTAGAVTALSVTPSESRVQQNELTTFEVDAVDAFGNDAGATADTVTLVSDHVDDVVQRFTVTFPSAGTRVITARLGEVTATASVDVAAPAPEPSSGPNGGSTSQTAGAALAGTGVEAPATTAGALLLLTLGAMLLGRRRRRRSPR